MKEERATAALGGPHLHRAIAMPLPLPTVSCCGPAVRGAAADVEDRKDRRGDEGGRTISAEYLKAATFLF